MDSPSNLPRIKSFSTPSNSGDHFQGNDNALPAVANEQKEIELDIRGDQDENQDTNAPFHLSHHHLLEQTKKRHEPHHRHSYSPHKGVDLSGDSGHRRASSPIASAVSAVSDGSVLSSHHHLSPTRYGGRLHQDSSSRSKSKYHSKLLSSRNFTNPSSSINSRSKYAQKNNETDKLQRRLQQLEQDMLSKNIQHDIMVNKEEMMSKRIKTKDARIKNLLNDINKLRQQLTMKTESQDKLINELGELQDQNRGLSTKLRESAMGLSGSGGPNDSAHSNQYRESTRDLMFQLQRDIQHHITAIHDLKDGKDKEAAAQPLDHSELMHLMKSTIQSTLTPVVEQMKQQEREFANTLQQQQSEWIESITLRIQQNQEIMDNNYKSMAQKVERRENTNRQALEHEIGALSSKMDEMDKHQRSKWKAVHQMVQKQELRMDAVNGTQIKELLDQHRKSMVQRQELTLNQLREDQKREVYAMKTELDSAIKKSKNEMESNIAQIATSITTMGSDIKYQLLAFKGGRAGDEERDERRESAVGMEKEALQKVNHQQSMVLEQYQRSIQNQSDRIKESVTMLQNVEDTVRALSKESKNVMDFMQQQTAKLMQIGDDNAEKMVQQISGLQPLFTKLYRYFEDTNSGLVDTINQNNRDMISSFTQHKNEFQKIIQSMNLQSTEHLESSSRPKPKEMDQILKEMRSMKESLGEAMSAKSERTSSEYSAIVDNMRKLTQRHNEVARIVTALPSSMQSLQTENSKICKEIANMNQSYLSTSKLIVPPSPSPPTTTQLNQVTVQTIKAMISRQIEEMNRQFVRSDGAMKTNLDKLAQHIKSGNVSLFENVQKLNDAQKQQIVDECGQRTASAIDSHQSVLKDHLLAIQRGLKQFNQTQKNLNDAISTGLTPTKSKVPSPPSVPSLPPSTTKDIAKMVVQRVGESNSKLMRDVMQQIGDVMAQREMHRDKGGDDEDAVKEMMSYLRCNLMKEVQLIKNLSNDIHKKSEQLPHVVARSKDLRKLEQNFMEFMASHSSKRREVELAVSPREHGAEDTMTAHRMKEWMENVMAQISRNRNECSLYAVVYVLSQIAFCSFVFVHRLGSGHDDDEKMEQKERTESECSEYLTRIQSKALSMLGTIERRVCDEEDVMNLDREEMIDRVMESMTSILSADSDRNGHWDHIWISRAGHSMSHFAHSELQRKRTLNAMQKTLDRLLSKQSTACRNMAVCQPLIFCSSLFVLLFGVWLQSIWTEQNIHH